MTNQQDLSTGSTKTTAFVFAGGGSLGAVQVGMLKALSQAGIKADLLVGASVGAINAAYFAGNPITEGAQLLEKIWLKLSRKDIFPVSPIHGMLALISFRSSFISPKSLKTFIRKEIKYENLEDAQVPVHVVATNALDGSRVVLSTGKVIPALMASTAIPGIFPSVTIGNQILIDGSVTNNTPILSAIQHEAQRIIILPTGSPCVVTEAPRGAVPIMLHALNLMIINQLVRDIRYYSDKVEIIVVPPLCPISSSIHDFSRSHELIQQSTDNTTHWLAQNRHPSGRIPHTLLPHQH